MNATLTHAAADDLRREARRLLREAADLLTRAGLEPAAAKRGIWFHNGDEVSMFVGTEPLLSRDLDDALAICAEHLLLERQRNIEKYARAAREAEVAVRRAALRESVIQGGKG